MATAATVATGTRTTIRTATTIMAVATTAGTATAVAAVIALLARPSSPLPLTAESACHGRLTATHARPLSVTQVPTRPASAAVVALLAGHSLSLTRLEPLGRRGLGAAITGPLLQHHGAPPTSDFGPGLGGQLRRDASHHSVSW
jgi:hypothetical protein